MAKHTKLRYQHDHFRELASGFSLIELMVSLAIAGFLCIGLWALMESQNKTYGLQDNTSQMQQSLRAAIDRISTDLLSAGEGPPWQMTINGATTTWYVTTPYNSVLNKLDMIGCAPSPTTLAAAANSGATQITLGVALPANTAYIDIGDDIGGFESAKVTAGAGTTTLTIDTKPNVAGGPHPLVGSYAQGANVCALQWITYAVNTAATPPQLTRDQHDGNGPLTVAYDVTALTPAVIVAPNPPDGGTVQITLNGSTTGPNAIQSTATNIIHMRNP
jgi:prepilin-type N-terminal cleavage/methylation domain-containing protein